MPLAYIRPINPPGELALVEIISLSPGTPPGRPHPEPPLGIWGPTDPRPSPPIAGIPGFPGYTPPGGGTQPPGIWGPLPGFPTHPISGIPGLPGYEPPSHPPEPTPGPGMQAIVLPVPPSDPPTPPPAGVPAGSTQMLIWFGPGTKPASAWVSPYPSQGPVPTPTP
jgi:hypothetical protein